MSVEDPTYPSYPLSPNPLPDDEAKTLLDKEFPEPEYIPDENSHVSCVMPTTTSREKFLPRAIKCWLKQTWPHRDLLIVHDGPGSITKTVAPFMEADPRVKLVHLEGERLLGKKYNDGISRATGPYIAFWADDDWHSPVRLESIMRTMIEMRAPVGGATTMLAFDTHSKQFYLYHSDPLRPYMVSGTMIFPKKRWDERRFPNVQRASDSVFANNMLMPDPGGNIQRWAIFNDPRIYCAVVHDTNTGNPLGDQYRQGAVASPLAQRSSWFPLTSEETTAVRLLFGDASAEFGF